MDGNTFLTDDAAFQNLKKYFEEKGKDLNIHQLFVQDSERFNKYRYFITLNLALCVRVPFSKSDFIVYLLPEASSFQPQPMAKFLLIIRRIELMKRL